MRDARSCDAGSLASREYFVAHELVFGHGTDNASDEAFWLLRHLQDWRDVDFGLPPDAASLPRALAIAARRVEQRKPLAYLLNEAWFAGLRFYRRRARARAALAARGGDRARVRAVVRTRARRLTCSTSARAAVASRSRPRTTAPDALVDATDISTARARGRRGATCSATSSATRVRLLRSRSVSRRRQRVIASSSRIRRTCPMPKWPRCRPSTSHEPAHRARERPDGLRAGRAHLLRGAASGSRPDGVLFLEARRRRRGVRGGASALAADRARVRARRRRRVRRHGRGNSGNSFVRG